MNTNEMKGVWIPFEILKDENLNDSEKLVFLCIGTTQPKAN